MNLELKSRDSFQVCGFCVETNLATCEKDLTELWLRFSANKGSFDTAFGYRKDFYGLMWLTPNDRYCYLIGVEAEKKSDTPQGAVWEQIPFNEYAVMRVPAATSAFDAWTEYYQKILPEAGYAPKKGHGFDFEYYPTGGGESYELWTPVEKR